MRRRLTKDSAFRKENNELEKDEIEKKNYDENWRRDVKFCFYCGTILFFIYFFTLHRSVPGGDSGELIVAAYELGVGHPPGYPLFILLSKLFITTIPFGSVAWRVNLMNAIFSTLSSVFLQLLILRLTENTGSCLLVYALFSLNPLTWQWSISAEVFSLNNFFCSLIFLLLFLFSQNEKITLKNQTKRLETLSFICGLSLSNQHTAIFVVMKTFIWILIKLKSHHKISDLKILVKLGFFFLLGLTPYLYLVTSSLLNKSRWSWGDQTTFSGFFSHLFRVEYGTFNLTKDGPKTNFATIATLYFQHLQLRMCHLSPWLSLIGLVTCLSWFIIRVNLFLFIPIFSTLFYFLFFFLRANLDFSIPLFHGVVERFWLQGDLAIVLLACIGFHTAIRLVVERFLGVQKLPMASVFTTLASLVLLILQLKNWTTNNNYSNLVCHEFGMNIMRSLPPGALVLTRGDLPSNILRYLQYCEKIRQDVEIFDVEILSYDWSIEKLSKFHPGIHFPGDRWGLSNGVHEDGKKIFNFKNFLDANSNKSIFLCIGMQEKDQSWKGHYELWPYGVCSSVHPSPFRPSLSFWANKTGGIADKWRHAYESFDFSSWERVANNEMWHAKIASAFYIYRVAMATNDLSYRRDLLKESYELYFRAIKLHQVQSRMNHKEAFPSFWHKNFALTCERLLGVDEIPGLDKIKLAKLSMFHFEQYLHLNPKDVDLKKIQEVLDTLKQRIKYFESLKKADKTLLNTLDSLDKINKISKQFNPKP